MVAGAVGGAMTGKTENIIFGAIGGMVFGGAGYAVYDAFGMVGVGAMIAGGGGYAYARGGWNGVAYYAGGVMGGMAGYAAGSYINTKWSSWFPTTPSANISPNVNNSTNSNDQILIARWEYSQSTGDIYYVDDTTELPYIQGRGYAGHGEGLNNPDMQDIPNIGPPPEGDYTIGPEQTNVTGSGTVLRGSMRLTPSPENEMYGRGGFLIHGGNMQTMDSSRGCIILRRDMRDIIGGSGDNALRVTQ
ncbi:MAG: tlde1 domain-containing protein [Nitrospirota bacterium]